MQLLNLNAILAWLFDRPTRADLARLEAELREECDRIRDDFRADIALLTKGVKEEGDETAFRVSRLDAKAEQAEKAAQAAAERVEGLGRQIDEIGTIAVRCREEIDLRKKFDSEYADDKRRREEIARDLIESNPDVPPYHD